MGLLPGGEIIVAFVAELADEGYGKDTNKKDLVKQGQTNKLVIAKVQRSDTGSTLALVHEFLDHYLFVDIEAAPLDNKSECLTVYAAKREMKDGMIT